MRPDAFLPALEKLMEVPPGSLHAETAFKKIDAWDSLRVVELVALLDTEYNVTVDYDKLIALNTVGDLISVIDSERARRADA